MNKVILIGRVCKDIELRYTSSNKAVASYTIAINRDKDNTDFINCVTWDKQAENMSKYCSKGSLIAIEGRIQTRNYDDKDGKKVYVTEVITSNVQFLDTKKETTPVEKIEKKEEDHYTDFGNSINADEIELTDDMLPF